MLRPCWLGRENRVWKCTSGSGQLQTPPENPRPAYRNLNQPTGSFIRCGSSGDWVPVQVIPGNNMSDEFDPTTPQQNFAAVTDSYAAGFSQNKTLDATAAPGQLYAVAVVDAGVDVSVSGRVGAERTRHLRPSSWTTLSRWPRRRRRSAAPPRSSRSASSPRRPSPAALP
jgi:hypothetical protein